MSKPYKEPAFPSHGTMGEVIEHGMTLRDWFAGQAMAGMLAAKSNLDDDDLAKYAYIVADAMLKEGEKPQ